MTRDPAPGDSADPESSAPCAGFRYVFFAALVAACFAVYQGSFTAPFMGDDIPMIVSNPYVVTPGRDTLREVFDPAGTPRYHTGGNYAPLQHIAHAIEWRVLGSDTLGTTS